ncbi:hypothetical protein HFO45_00575 [Rhizobium leguminosarum]|uniref:hypothetical protein n=1 Tax=Rhizobium leguminosarum TaxID=384 RepID=UPI001C98DA39|nr:hypothetical protein [Rhizobium leguminosarum]MBY5646777.1 hypothetical protein [Rhizobium leguminosarum]
MAFFESMLTLLLVAIVFLQFSRKFRMPYPTVLAITGVIVAKRRRLAAMRRADEIDDDVFHMLEQELDWAELAALQPGRDGIVES